MSSPVHKGNDINMEVNEGNESPSTLEKRLSNYREPLRQPFIYKVQNFYLRDNNDNAHEPRILAIGPYHHGKQNLETMEEHKLRYLKSLILRKNHEVDRYILAIAEIEKEARSCYAEKISLSSSEFTEMLVLDSCFIIELLWKLGGHDSSSCASDPIFQIKWFLVHLKRDLTLLENQIPFFVLCKLFNLINEGAPNQNQNQQQLLIESMFNFLGLGTNMVTDEVMHLLHLKHATERPSPIRYNSLHVCPRQWEFHWIPSATELKDANVTFRNTSSNIPFELGFNNGVLTMSTLTIHDQTDCDLRNLILYEQYFPGHRPTYVTDYVMVLDCLVNTGRDVEILSQHGIVKNMTGHNQMAADIINRLAQSAIVSQKHFIYCNTFKQINAHHKRWWNKVRGILDRDYFNSPWAYISIFAALFLLLLTLAQTIISAIQLRKDGKRKKL